MCVMSVGCRYRAIQVPIDRRKMLFVRVKNSTFNLMTMEGRSTISQNHLLCSLGESVELPFPHIRDYDRGLHFGVCTKQVRYV